MSESNINETLDIPPDITDKWQTILDIAAELMKVPAALIMRLKQPYIEVLLSSHSQDNPYKPGDKELFEDSGLYCEKVIKSQHKLLIPNALHDENWCDNPDIKLNMISYLGFPLILPNNTPFGTICALDRKENHYSNTYEQLLLSLRDVIQSQLNLIYMNLILNEEKRSLTDYMNEIKVLRGIVPICGFCKKIRDQNGDWHQMESYISKHSEAQFSTSFCPSCGRKHFGNLVDQINQPPKGE
jgi:transcriptional regulator with GAF, ATPase, and Fis domain